MMEFLRVAIGAASVVSLGYSIWPNLTHKKLKHRKMAVVALVVFVTLSVLLYLVPATESEPEPVLVTQAGSIEVSNRLGFEFEVYYPREYESPPNLTISLREGTSGNVRITEQRSNGFRFETSGLSYVVERGAHIEWNSIGSISAR